MNISQTILALKCLSDFALRGIRLSLSTMLLVAAFVIATTSQAYALPGDVNGDGRVDGTDLLEFSRTYGLSSEAEGWNAAADFDDDGDVDDTDLEVMRRYFGRLGREQTCWVMDSSHDDVFHVSGTGYVLDQIEGFRDPNDADVDLSDGSCWVVDRANDRVVKLSARDEMLLQVHGFSNPARLAVDQSSGAVWVTDEDLDAVVRLAADVTDGYDIAVDTGSHMTVVGFSRPGSVSLDPLDGLVWIADTEMRRVVRLDMAVAPDYDISVDTGSHVVVGQLFLTSPIRVAVDTATGACYVLDDSRESVVKVAQSGLSHLWEADGMSSPADIAVNTIEGSCWVVCDGSNEVVKLSAEGAELMRVGGFTRPKSAAVDPLDGICWVTDTSRNTLTKLSPLGAKLIEVDGFSNPVAAAASPGVAPAGAPVAAASVSPAVSDVDEDVTFDGSASTDIDGAIVLYEWDFDGDGVYDWNSDTGGVTTYAYPSAGVYNPVFRVTDTDHLQSVDYTSVVRIGSLTAIAAADPPEGLAPLEVQFTGTFIDPVDGRIEFFQWDFDSDGTFEEFSETSGDTTHTYNTAGEYTATLKIVDFDGTNVQDTVDISVSSSGPEVNASASPDADSSMVSFDGSAHDPDGSVVLYQWDFDGDDTFDWSNTSSAAATHKYPAKGTYNAALQATDNDGQTASAAVSVLWPPVAVADISPLVGNAPLTINYDGSGSTATQGAIAEYDWTFTWGQYSDTVSGTHTYDTEGTYTVELTVTNDSGAQDTETVDVIARPDGTPFAVASSDYAGPGGPPMTVNFSAAGSSDTGGGIVLYEWDLGFKAGVDSAGYYDGNSCSITLNGLDIGTESRGFNIVVVDPSDYSIIGRASFDTHGSSATSAELAAYIDGIETGMLVMAGIKDDGFADLTEQGYLAIESIGSTEIRNLAQGDSFAIIGYKDGASGSAVELLVPSGDGPAEIEKLFEPVWSSGSTGDTSFTYTEPGNYDATLTVTDGDGLTDSDSVTIEIPSNPTVTAVSPEPGSTHYKTDVPFDATTFDADGEIVNIEWDFDNDGTFDSHSSSETYATHTFAGPGTYTATVRVTDNDAMTATDQVEFDVIETGPSDVVASTDPVDAAGEPPLTIQFDGSFEDADGTIVMHEWDFDGDGTYNWTNGGTAGTVWAWPSYYGTHYTPTKMIDGDLTTYWQTEHDPVWPQDIVFSLDGDVQHSIDRIRVLANKSYKIHEFEILVSTTSATSGFVSAGTFAMANEPAWQEFTFAAASARYVMLRVTSSFNDGRTYANINEFEVYAGLENVITSAGPRTAHTYSSAGVYNATLRVTDNDGLTETDSVAVTVYDAGDPLATASARRVRGPVDLDFLLQGSATDDGTITQFEWDFDNDGTFEWNDTATGVIDSFTSEYNDTNWAAANVIDGRTGAGYSWASVHGVVFPQEMVFSFAGGSTHSIDAALFDGATGSSANDSPKDVELWVSTTAPDSGYSLVGTFELGHHNGVQPVTFPAVDARYVKLVILSNHGGSYCRMAEFEVFSALDGNNLLAVSGNAWHSWNTEGVHTARLRATDDEANQGTDDIEITTVPQGESLTTMWVSEYDEIGMMDILGNDIKRVYGFNDPVAVEIDSDRHTVWTADKNNDRIVALDTEVSHGYDTRYNENAHREYRGLDGPRDLSLDPTDGSIWATDYDNGRVVHIGPEFPAGYNVSASGTSPSAGPGGTGVYLVGTPSSVAGSISQAISFTNGDYGILPDQTFDGLEDFTFEAWVDHSYAHDGTLISCANISWYNDFLVILRQNGTEIDISIADTTETFTVADMNDGSPHHIAVTRSGTNLTLYIDGSSTSSETVSSAPLRVSAGGAIIGQDQDSLHGRFSSSQEIDGTIDDVRLWNTARSEGDIAATRNSALGGAETGLA